MQYKIQIQNRSKLDSFIAEHKINRELCQNGTEDGRESDSLKVSCGKYLNDL